MSDEKVKETVEKTQVAEEQELIWHKTAHIGVPSVVYRKDLAAVKLADLPLPEEIAATTTVKTMGEYVRFIDDDGEPVAVIINPDSIDKSAEPIASGIQRRPQWISAFMDACTGRYEILSIKHHQVMFDRNLAVASNVKMTFKNGRWTSWDWYKGLQAFQPRNAPLARAMLDKHNSLVAILTAQTITVPFGADSGHFEWFQESLELPLEEWITTRPERFDKLRVMQQAYRAATNAMYRRKHNIKMGEFSGEPGVYEMYNAQGVLQGEKTYDPSKDHVIGQFNYLVGKGYTFKLVQRADE
jgi:hypothetical protein